MAAQVLHVTNQGQSVRVRMWEGMRGRSLGRPSSAPPCGCRGDLQEAIVLSSLVFNKWGLQHQLSAGMPRACQVTPSCQPWRCQRVTPDMPHMWGMCSPPPSLLKLWQSLYKSKGYG